MGVARARRVLHDLQAGCAGDVVSPAVEERWIGVACDWNDVRVRLIRPSGVTAPLPVIVYVHGGGWMFGDSLTHDRLVRELAVGARAAVAFVDYDRSPEAQYPAAIEQTYAVAEWVTRHGMREALDPARMAIAGDSEGGAIAAAVTLLAKDRGTVAFAHQLLLYPVTDAAQDTSSYREFAEGPILTAAAMTVFWDNYLPEVALRADATASPLRAPLDRLRGLPPALVVVCENDVLRDEGESYARRLAAAGVPTTSVRFNGVLHDFMVLNPLRAAPPTDTAIELVSAVLRKVLAPRGTRSP